MTSMRACTKCLRSFPFTAEFFTRRSDTLIGLRSQCKPCTNARDKRWANNPEKERQRVKAYRLANPETVQNTKKRWNDANREHNTEMHRLWIAKNRDHANAYQREYNKKNSDKIREINKKKTKKRLQNDPAYRIQMNLYSRMRLGLRRVGAVKKGRYVELIGCTYTELKAYIGDKLESGMTWENYGGWHIDHIIPCAAFDLTDPEQQWACFHYTNLQPLWAEDNLKKGTKILE